MTFSIKDFFSKCDQIHSFLRIWSHLLKILNGKLHFLCSDVVIISDHFHLLRYIFMHFSPKDLFFSIKDSLHF